MSENTAGGPAESANSDIQQSGPGQVGDVPARNWAMLCHLSALTMWMGLPFGNILGPLIVWLVKKDEYGLVDEHGKEALNFQISWAIYGIISAILVVVVVGLLLLAILFVAHLILTIYAAVEASKGRLYRYPLTIRFLG